MFLGSGILDLSPLGFKGFQLGSLSLGITSISSIAAQSSLWLRLSVWIIILADFQVLTGFWVQASWISVASLCTNALG